MRWQAGTFTLRFPASKKSQIWKRKRTKRMSEAPIAVQAKKNPSDFLRQVLGKPVIVQLNSGTTYRGNLQFSGICCSSVIQLLLSFERYFIYFHHGNQPLTASIVPPKRLFHAPSNFYFLHRNIGLSRWVYEYSYGTDGRI